MDVYFSQHFGVAPKVLDDYGALDISVVSDLPLFVDPFLLFNSEKPEYVKLHDEIVEYLVFLRDQASSDLNPALIQSWYRFQEVKQNWLGFTLFGNSGQGLGSDFAQALHDALGDIFTDFGTETVTQGTHLEKLCLIRPGVGRDNVSDFTTNLIKGFLCEYTRTFAEKHLKKKDCARFTVEKAHFNYKTRTWVSKPYHLPRLRDDYVLLTPTDILTKDDTWINHADMMTRFPLLPNAIPNEQLRAQVEQYIKLKLGDNPGPKETRAASAAAIRRFPELIDLYIKLKEDSGDQASAISAGKVDETRRALVVQLQQALAHLQANTDFFDRPWMSYTECLARARFFKDYIENNDGYRLFSNAGKPFSSEKELQLAFGLVWCGSDFDLNREANNGRGPVDFKASYGAGDKSLIEFKLASNRQLSKNLANQVKIYEAANKTHTSVKVIVFYTAAEEARVKKILVDLKLENDPSIVLIDARHDNKPSASTA